ncbi:copper resistance CopC family protein [Arthrobacter sp.]|uniref:copper resistance CopC family protein n=1 Tax=Arthrobacter sp. TaxID=1667 RepID=UPI003A942D6B
MNPTATAPYADRVPAVPHAGPGTGIRALLVSAAAALMATVALVFAPSASAHDALIGSTPKNGASVEGGLESMELNFSGDLKRIGNQVSLSDADGTKFEATTTISGAAMSVDFGQPLPAGDYTLTWRVVSSDGHPIEGTKANQQAVAFTVAPDPSAPPAPAMSSPATPAATSTAPAATSGNQSPTPAAAPDSTQGDSSGGLPAAVVWIILAVAVVAAAAIVLAKARRQGGPGR